MACNFGVDKSEQIISAKRLNPTECHIQDKQVQANKIKCSFYGCELSWSFVLFGRGSKFVCDWLHPRQISGGNIYGSVIWK